MSSSCQFHRTGCFCSHKCAACDRRMTHKATVRAIAEFRQTARNISKLYK